LSDPSANDGGDSRFEITQIGIVVADIDRAVRGYHATFDWGPWRIFDLLPPENHSVTLRGRPIECGFRIALTTVGPIDLELIQPLEGEGQHHEFLAATGGGINHVLVRRFGADGEQLEVDGDALGLVDLMSATFGSVDYTYRESKELGAIFEFVRGSAVRGEIEPTAVYP
jgi:hypothetical protein